MRLLSFVIAAPYRKPERELAPRLAAPSRAADGRRRRAEFSRQHVMFPSGIVGALDLAAVVRGL